MNVRQRSGDARVRVRKAAAKLRWGARAVGIPATVRGLVRLAVLAIRAKPRATIRLKSGPVLAFDYPRQLVPALVVFGDYIDPEFAFLRRIAKPDWLVLDIGAAIGQFSVFAAQLPAARVHAFEPSSDNIATLAENLARNGVTDRVHIHHLALSHTDAELSFPTLRNPFLSRLDHTSDAVGTETVAVRTLTGVLAELGLDRVDCLKLNVAGFESEVLQGGSEFLSRQGADVLVMLISEGLLPWCTELAGFGYRFFFFHPIEIRLYELPDVSKSAGFRDRPWPARHVIAVSERAIGHGILRNIAVVSASRGTA